MEPVTQKRTDNPIQDTASFVVLGHFLARLLLQLLTKSAQIASCSTHSDSTDFSLPVAIQLMMPTEEEIIKGIQYLALGIVEEEFASPYYWHVPSIVYLHYDHEQRQFLKNFKYDKRELMF